MRFQCDKRARCRQGRSSSDLAIANSVAQATHLQYHTLTQPPRMSIRFERYTTVVTMPGMKTFQTEVHGIDYGKMAAD